jgi:hypothetical protein
VRPGTNFIADAGGRGKGLVMVQVMAQVLSHAGTLDSPDGDQAAARGGWV